MSDSGVTHLRDWHERRLHAEKRPVMYLGEPSMAHRTFILSCLRLVWQAKVFLRPQSVTIDLSPTQYIVRAECGPLIRPIQRIFTFGNAETLASPWGTQGPEYFSKIIDEDEQRRIPFSRQRHRWGWRYCFSGPTGPRLNEPSYPSVLARRLAWGLRTNDGLWCEAYKEGKPIAKPFCLEVPSSIGLLAAADLDPQWFTGLPFTQDDVARLTHLSHRSLVTTPVQKPSPNWTPGNISVKWHPQDDLVSDWTLTADGVNELLSVST